jgi:hypothetical protein
MTLVEAVITVVSVLLIIDAWRRDDVDGGGC